MTSKHASLTYCKKCFSPNLRPNVSFLDTGVCMLSIIIACVAIALILSTIGD